MGALFWVGPGFAPLPDSLLGAAARSLKIEKPSVIRPSAYWHPEIVHAYRAMPCVLNYGNLLRPQRQQFALCRCITSLQTF